ncbi:MAG: metallopeptidase family protein [Terrimicrobiaceae bacterium]
MNFETLSLIANEVVATTLASLPDELREAARRVPVLLEKRPDAGDIEAGLDPDLLGLFDPGPHDTPHIRLWLKNLWEYSDEEEDIFREEVRVTLLHEIGHLLGWDEEDLDERGLG